MLNGRLSPDVRGRYYADGSFFGSCIVRFKRYQKRWVLATLPLSPRKWSGRAPFVTTHTGEIIKMFNIFNVVSWCVEAPLLLLGYLIGFTCNLRQVALSKQRNRTQDLLRLTPLLIEFVIVTYLTGR